MRHGRTGGLEFLSLAATGPLFPFSSPPGRLHNPKLCLQKTASFTSILYAKRGEKQRALEECPVWVLRKAASAAQTAHKDTVLFLFFKRKDDGAKMQHSSALQPQRSKSKHTPPGSLTQFCGSPAQKKQVQGSRMGLNSNQHAVAVLSLSCPYKLPSRPSAAPERPVHLHRLVRSCSSYREAPQLLLFLWVPISFAAR